MLPEIILQTPPPEITELTVEELVQVMDLFTTVLMPVYLFVIGTNVFKMIVYSV